MADSLDTAALQAHFLSLVPTIETHGRIFFHHIRCPHRKADAIAEMVALGWKWFRRLVEREKDVNEFVNGFVTLLAKAVNSGRRCVGMNKTKDVMNPHTQRRENFTVESLPSSPRKDHHSLYGDPHGQHGQDRFEERLADNTVTPVPDQVQFRIDFPAWLRTLTGRERRLIRAMARNERTKDLGKQFDLSPGRISQLRQEFRQGWNRFCTEPTEHTEAA